MQLNKKIIIAMLSFQFLILLGMVSFSMYPLMYGQEIKMKIRPFDPRDLMRGNYVRLNYDFNRLQLENAYDEDDFIEDNIVKSHLDTNRTYNFGEVVYVELQKKQGYYQSTAVWAKKPADDKIYLKATVDSHYGYGIHLHAGIEDFFTDVEQAKSIEKMMFEEADKDKTFAVIKIAKNGMARLVDVRVE